MWVLTPRDPEDFLIQPFTSLEPPYFCFLEASNDLLMSVPSSAGEIQILTRTEHPNQQWTFLPVFAQLGNEG